MTQIKKTIVIVILEDFLALWLCLVGAVLGYNYGMCIVGYYCVVSMKPTSSWFSVRVMESEGHFSASDSPTTFHNIGQFPAKWFTTVSCKVEVDGRIEWRTLVVEIEENHWVDYTVILESDGFLRGRGRAVDGLWIEWAKERLKMLTAAIVPIAVW